MGYLFQKLVCLVIPKTDLRILASVIFYWQPPDLVHLLVSPMRHDPLASTLFDRRIALHILVPTTDNLFISLHPSASSVVAS